MFLFPLFLSASLYLLHHTHLKLTADTHPRPTVSMDYIFKFEDLPIVSVVHYKTVVYLYNINKF